MKYTLSWITTTINQARHLSLQPQLKYLDKRSLNKQKEKRENKSTAEALYNCSKLSPRIPSKFLCNQPHLLLQK